MVTYQGPQPRMMTAGGPAPAAAASGGGGHVVRQSGGSEEDRKKAVEEAEKQLRELQRQQPTLVDYAIYFEEWREVDGVKFPFKMRRAMAGMTTEEWTINKVKVNPRVDPKRFAGES